MNTSAHLTSFSRTCWALGDFRSSVMPRLLRLAKCQGYASFACGCGGILCPILQVSPAGGSTLMTSAPKSDKMTSGAWARDETREVHDLQAGEDIFVWHGFSSFSV